VHPAVIYFWPPVLSAEQLWSITGFWFGAYLVASGLMTAACVGLALLSWHALEKHFLRLRFRFVDRPSPVLRGTGSREPIDSAVTLRARAEERAG
jgi:peptidoglycan/LPS O-acetylase OafA/YrhL